MLTKTRRPVMLIVGEVIGKEAKQKYENDRATGDTERFDVTILQANHAMPDVRFLLRQDSPAVPEIGQSVALIVEAGETREWGANFRAVRYATEDDVQSVLNHLTVVAAK